MKKIPIFSFAIFLVLIVSFIVIFNINNDPYGKSFVDQVRIADSNSTLIKLSNDELVAMGKAICESSSDWIDEKNSLDVIQNVVSGSEIVIFIDDRIIPILRFQSTYELCPEYVDRLEGLFIEK